jgi:hypothetical protein
MSASRQFRGAVARRHSVDLDSQRANLRSEAANHATQPGDSNVEARDFIAGAADRQIVSGDCACEAAVRGTEAAHQHAMSSALITLGGDRGSG